jgi:hypothetical protein
LRGEIGMPIYYVETPNYKSYERQLPNGKYRYEGYKHSIHYCIDATTKKTEDEINIFLDNSTIDFLIDNEKYIINLK